jgi:hypothetical protein
MSDEFWDDAEEFFSKMLEDATKFEGVVDDAEKQVKKAHVEETRKFLADLCKSMKKVVAALEGKSSPLGKFLAHARDVPAEKDKAKAEQQLTDFLDKHGKQFTKAPKWAVAGLRNVLKEFASQTIEYGAKVEDLRNDLLKNTRQFQEQVCMWAATAEKVEEMLKPKLLRAIVLGVKGVATAGIDIVTFVKTAPVGLVLIYHAVRSTLSGSKMIYKAITLIRDEGG